MDYVKDRSIDFAKWLYINNKLKSILSFSNSTFDDLYEEFMEEQMVKEYENEKLGELEVMAQWDI